MALLGKAAMVLSFDIAPGAIGEHDHWHTHEHLPERLSIPGFRRGSRWIAVSGTPRYLVVYEVDELAVLASPSYLERLDAPTPWTTRMMTHYRGMKRGLCRVQASCGIGIGAIALLIHCAPAPGRRTDLRDWLARDVLPAASARPGLMSVHVLESALAPSMTAEQQIRGADTEPGWVVLATGYDGSIIEKLLETDLRVELFAGHGADPDQHSAGVYALHCMLTDRDAAASTADPMGTDPAGLVPG